MPETVNMYEAKTQLSKLVERAASGEEIVIARAGQPRARLVPLDGASKRRQPGGWQGRLQIADSFDDPLPESLLEAFEGGAPMEHRADDEQPAGGDA